jgi:hypothetical protein
LSGGDCCARDHDGRADEGEDGRSTHVDAWSGGRKVRFERGRDDVKESLK